MVTNKIRPYKSDTYHRSESCYAVDITHVGILNVETGGFHRPETRLDLPTFFYCCPIKLDDRKKLWLER